MNDPAEADLELFCNCWSAGFLGERLYDRVEAVLQELCNTQCSIFGKRL